ncbi:MAG: T9SS type A sorting domain-containing protein, partial [Lewinellaceae bacterium]|nr:T9SS type A sorting domain-containing protein [Lewinellaceae bacterium]
FLSLNCLEAGTTYYIQWDDIWDDVSFDFTITMLPSVVDQTGGSTCQFSIDDPNFVDNGAICSDFTFPASTGSTDAEDIDPDIDYGCLGTTPNPAWYYIEMSSDGDFEFEITADPAVDVDYAIWGPFSDLNAAISSCNWGTPIVCDYSTNPGGSGSIPCAMTGNVYLVLITNYSSDPTDISMNQTGGTAVPDCSIVMPVIIKSFNAVNKGNYNEVTWESSSEFNSHLYVLEKKVKDQWISINEVESKNRPYGANYSIKDPDVLKENYYRLKMIDYDGSTEYSTVIYVRGYVHDNLVLFPNPVMEKINFSIEGTEIYGDIEIKIFNSTGELVKNLKMSLDSERNTIDSKDLKNGVYYIEITSSLDTWKTKFVKN